MSEPRPPAEGGSLQLRLAADASGLASGQRAVRAFLAASSAISERAAYYTELAFEELVTNVIRYGCRADGIAPQVDVTVRVTEARVMLVIEDDGPPFDPLTAPAPARPGSLDEATVGGLGIFLVRKTAEHMAYQRAGERNRITIAIAQHGD